MTNEKKAAIKIPVALVAKLVDALASGASAFTGVLVRVQSRAPDLIVISRQASVLRDFLLSVLAYLVIFRFR